MSEKRKAALIRKMKKLSLACSILDVSFENLTEENEIGEEEDLSKNVNFFSPIISTTS